MRPMPVDLHPVDRLGVLQRAPVGHPVPMDVHGSGQTGRVLDERVRRSHQDDHRRQLGRLVERGEPLNHAGVASAERGHRPIAPVLRRRPGDDIDTVDPVVAVRRERPIGIATAPHVDPDGDVTAVGERVGPGAGPFSATSVRGPHHHRGRRQLVGEDEVGG